MNYAEYLNRLATGAVRNLQAVIGAAWPMQLILAKLDRRGHLIQHLVQDCLQLQAAQLCQLLVNIPGHMDSSDGSSSLPQSSKRNGCMLQPHIAV